jgi:transposase
MTQIGVLITHHLRGLRQNEKGGSLMTEPGHSHSSSGGRRRKRFLSPSEKYELWIGLLRGELTTREAADRAGVDRTTIMRVRQVAKQGALDALSSSRPGVRTGGVDPELAEARAEVARLSEAIKEMGVRLMLAEGKGRWD